MNREEVKGHSTDNRKSNKHVSPCGSCDVCLIQPMVCLQCSGFQLHHRLSDVTKTEPETGGGLFVLLPAGRVSARCGRQEII